MKQVNIHRAKTHLSRLLEEVSAGEEVTIAKAGKPLARLVPLAPARRARKPGFLKGRIRIAADFDAPLPDALLDAFEGKS
jgi:prevent-host-death family protein